jgi:hypothetical protein
MKTKKPILYIDVDDTLIARDSDGEGLDGYNLRPRVVSRLRELTKHFDCRWLTCWPEDRIKALLYLLYASDLVRKIDYQNWKFGDGGSWGKAAAVLAGPRDFWWLEDPLPTGECLALKREGCLDRYIEVNPVGLWSFDEAFKKLNRRTGFRRNGLGRDRRGTTAGRVVQSPLTSSEQFKSRPL